ncbi:MAG: hypothetical protein LBF37_02935 [Rickettsiales bacterium]|jgi:hypothetical protein|nr:hypothetical protein [Rickettsiales bacterium]
MEFKTIMTATPLARLVGRLYYEHTYSQQIWNILGTKSGMLAFNDGRYIIFRENKDQSFYVSRTNLSYNEIDLTDRVSQKFLKKLYSRLEANMIFMRGLEKIRNQNKK